MIGSYEVVTTIRVVGNNPNQLKWWTMSTPFVNLEKGEWHATHARSLASPGRGRDEPSHALRRNEVTKLSI